MHVVNTKPKIIINADDFGRDNFVNQSIVENLLAGNITSTTIMPVGNAFEKACEIAHDNKISNKIGVHLTLNEGIPISEEMKQYTNADGEMCLSRMMFIGSLDLRNAMIIELRAQIKRVIDYGIIPTHLDSHRHFHTSFPIGRIAIMLASEFGIRCIRIARNCAHNNIPHKQVYKWLFNRYLSGRVVFTTCMFFRKLVYTN